MPVNTWIAVRLGGLLERQNQDGSRSFLGRRHNVESAAKRFHPFTDRKEPEFERLGSAVMGLNHGRIEPRTRIADLDA